jgi:predicted small secreted protein
MERREFLRNFLTGIIIGVATAHVFVSNAKSSVCDFLTNLPQGKKTPAEILKEMYKEVVELGPYENDDFIKREFHMELDSDENNSEEHVVFLIQSDGDKESMIIQVTYFNAPRTRIIKYAKDIKTILCHVKGDDIEIKKCDYSENDIKSLFPDILQGIRNKKKFLKLIDRKNKK